MSKQNKENTQSFMNNVTIILISQVLVKVLGMVYRIVITNIDGFGDEGLGFYNVGFQIYTLLLAISSVGIPNAISKMVSERVALDDYKGAHKIFKTALLLFSIIGLVTTAVLFFGADIFAQHIIKIDGSQYVMRALAPSLFFVCVSSVNLLLCLYTFQSVLHLQLWHLGLTLQHLLQLRLVCFTWYTSIVNVKAVSRSILKNQKAKQLRFQADIL